MDNRKAELEQRAKAYQQILQEEGYGARDPEWDPQMQTWDLRVKYEGMFMLIMFDLDDPDFVRLVLPNFFDISPEQLQPAMVALEMTNKKCKGAKLYLNRAQNDTIASVEVLDGGAGMRAAFLTRYLDMLVGAAKFFVENLKKQMNELPPFEGAVLACSAQAH